MASKLNDPRSFGMKLTEPDLTDQEAYIYASCAVITGILGSGYNTSSADEACDEISRVADKYAKKILTYYRKNYPKVDEDLL